MAITDAKKIDYLWKKVGFGATKTDTNAAKAGPNEAIASPLLLRGDKTWNEANNIPGVMPGSSAGIVTVYPTSAPDETTMDNTATTNRTWKTGLTDWIPPEFGSTYLVKVYVHTSSNAGSAAGSGDTLSATGSGNNDEWIGTFRMDSGNWIYGGERSRDIYPKRRFSPTLGRFTLSSRFCPCRAGCKRYPKAGERILAFRTGLPLARS